MKSMTDMVIEARQHTPLEPTKVEEPKIAIIKRALNRLADVKKDKLAQIIENPEIAKEFRILSDLWANLQ